MVERTRSPHSGGRVSVRRFVSSGRTGVDQLAVLLQFNRCGGDRYRLARDCRGLSLHEGITWWPQVVLAWRFRGRAMGFAVIPGGSTAPRTLYAGSIAWVIGTTPSTRIRTPGNARSRQIDRAMPGKRTVSTHRFLLALIRCAPPCRGGGIARPRHSRVGAISWRARVKDRQSGAMLARLQVKSRCRPVAVRGPAGGRVDGRRLRKIRRASSAR
jgi:hypothetical protein